MENPRQERSKNPALRIQQLTSDSDDESDSDTDSISNMNEGEDMSETRIDEFISQFKDTKPYIPNLDTKARYVK